MPEKLAKLVALLLRDTEKDEHTTADVAQRCTIAERAHVRPQDSM